MIYGGRWETREMRERGRRWQKVLPARPLCLWWMSAVVCFEKVFLQDASFR